MIGVLMGKGNLLGDDPARPYGSIAVLALRLLGAWRNLAIPAPLKTPPEIHLSRPPPRTIRHG